jgi:predicted kinase
MGKPELIMMVGFPCSGKTTFIKKSYPNHKINSYDDVMCEVYPGETYSESFVKADYKKVLEECYKRLDSDLEAGYDIVLDWTNLSPKSRRAKLRKVPRYYVKRAVVLIAKKEELYRRNQIRAKEGKYIPQKVYDNMFKSYKKPTEAEGFDSVRIIYG